MSKQSDRRRKARMIRAASEAADVIALDAPIEIVAAAGDDTKGPRRFTMLAYAGGKLKVSQYPFPIVVDLAGLEFRTPQLPTYFGHSDGSDASRLVGHSDRHDVSGGRLIVAGAMSAANDKAREVVATHDNGYQWQASIGVLPSRAHLQEIRAGDRVTVNGRQFTGPIIVARKSVLCHVAILPEGADKDTQVSIAATAAKGQPMTLQEFISTAFAGDVPTLTDKQTAILQAHYAKSGAMIEGAAGGLTFDVDAITAIHAKYLAAVEARAGTYAGKVNPAKIGEITAKTAADGSALLEAALTDERSAAWLAASLCKPQSQAAIELIHAERPTAPPVYGSRTDMNPQIIEAALCLNSGIEKPEAYFKEDVLEVANRGGRHPRGPVAPGMLAPHRNRQSAVSARPFAGAGHYAGDVACPAKSRFIGPCGYKSNRTPGSGKSADKKPLFNHSHYGGGAAPGVIRLTFAGNHGSQYCRLAPHATEVESAVAGGRTSSLPVRHVLCPRGLVSWSPWNPGGCAGFNYRAGERRCCCPGETTSDDY